MSEMNTVRVIEVIETTLTKRGEGKDENDPIRIVTQYWSRDGELLAERDRWKEEQEGRLICMESQK